MIDGGVELKGRENIQKTKKKKRKSTYSNARILDTLSKGSRREVNIKKKEVRERANC